MPSTRPSTVEYGRQPSHRNSMIAAAIANAMPGIAPSTATPIRQPMDNQNSQRWIRKMRFRSRNSNSPIAEEITMAASALLGKFLIKYGAYTSSTATDRAPITPVTWVRAPAASATGVREELLLIGNP